MMKNKVLKILAFFDKIWYNINGDIMTKSELIKEVYRQNDYNYVEIESIINQTFEIIMNALTTEDKVVISGFGTFEKYYQEGYNGINPATGSKLFVEGNYKVRFNASKKLKSMMK